MLLYKKRNLFKDQIQDENQDILIIKESKKI